MRPPAASHIKHSLSRLGLDVFVFSDITLVDGENFGFSNGQNPVGLCERETNRTKNRELCCTKQHRKWMIMA